MNKVLYLIVVHSKGIIDFFEREGKYKGIDYRYLLVGIHEEDFSNEKIIQCDRLTDNIEKYRYALAYTGWWAFVKNCIQDYDHEYFVCLEYDSNIAYDKLNYVEECLDRNSPIYGAAKMPTSVCFGPENIVEFLRDKSDPFQIKDYWIASNNVIFRRDFLISFINDPILKDFIVHLNNAPATGHVLERYTSVYCYMRDIPIDFIEGVYDHVALDSHNTQNSYSKYINFIQNICRPT